MKNKLSRSIFILLFSCFLQFRFLPSRAAEVPSHPAFGVMVHYLPAKGTLPAVDQSAIARFADDLQKMGAEYFIFTLGQNNGQFIAPNQALVDLCPFARLNEPAVDLPMLIGRALSKRGIGLVLYLPFRSPQGDRELMRCLGDGPEQTPTNSTFISNWSAVIRYWSLHYGTLAKGWWFDGVYNTTGMSAKDWSVICEASRAGDKTRWLAFNAGEGLQRFDRVSAPCQDVMAGEMMDLPTKASVQAASKDIRFHVLTPLTDSWGRGGNARYTSSEIRQSVALAKSVGGMLTLDIPVNNRFQLDARHVELVRQAMSAARTQLKPSIYQRPQ
jgi:hypothetical protein